MGRIFASEIWGAYFWEGLLSEFYGIRTWNSKKWKLIRTVPMSITVKWNINEVNGVRLEKESL